MLSLSSGHIIILDSRIYCLANLFAKQELSEAPVATMYGHDMLFGNLSLLSRIFLCLASKCTYRVYEIGPCLPEKRVILCAKNAEFRTKQIPEMEL